MPAIDTGRLERAFAVISRGCESGAFAGAVAAVGGVDGILAVRAFGFAATVPEQVSMRINTVFDLASLTKVVATGPAILRLVEDGLFPLETPVQSFIPEFGDNRVTVRHLLTHTSGLPHWRALYLDYTGWEECTLGICMTSLVRSPGTRVEYSDLGFILLGEIVRRATGMEFDKFCRQQLFEPLGMSETVWRPQFPRHRVAATERGNGAEMQLVGDRSSGFTRWRSGVIWGEVHDGNAWYGLGGVASHTGLFSTAADLSLFARYWLAGGGGVLSRQMVALAARNQTAGMGMNRGLAWYKPPTEPFPEGSPSCGDLFSAASFGHTGLTGTSIWIDPERDLFVILLTNRLHPTPNEGIATIRPRFHNAVAASLV